MIANPYQERSAEIAARPRSSPSASAPRECFASAIFGMWSTQTPQKHAGRLVVRSAEQMA